jgi:hypothetical protein
MRRTTIPRIQTIRIVKGMMPAAVLIHDSIAKVAELP